MRKQKASKCFKQELNQCDLSFEKISLAVGRKIKWMEKRAVVEKRRSETLRAAQPGDAGGLDKGSGSDNGEDDRIKRSLEVSSRGSSSFITGT